MNVETGFFNESRNWLFISAHHEFICRIISAFNVGFNVSKSLLNVSPFFHYLVVNKVFIIVKLLNRVPCNLCHVDGA